MIFLITITSVLRGHLLITNANLEGGRVKTKVSEFVWEEWGRGYMPVRA